ncbi:MAG: NAD(P)H-dependent oxidoreductase subunit E [bacterium]
MSARDVVTRFAPKRENILLMFHALQERNADESYVAPEDIATVADYLGLSVAEVDGVLSFYHAFAREPRGRHVIRLCDSLSCRICGSLDLYRHLRTTLGIGNGETTADARFSLETVNCLGCCNTAPNAMIDDRLYRNLTRDDVDGALDEVKP